MSRGGHKGRERAHRKFPPITLERIVADPKQTTPGRNTATGKRDREGLAGANTFNCNPLYSQLERAKAPPCTTSEMVRLVHVHGRLTLYLCGGSRNHVTCKQSSLCTAGHELAGSTHVCGLLDISVLEQPTSDALPAWSKRGGIELCPRPLSYRRRPAECTDRGLCVGDA